MIVSFRLSRPSVLNLKITGSLSDDLPALIRSRHLKISRVPHARVTLGITSRLFEITSRPFLGIALGGRGRIGQLVEQLVEALFQLVVSFHGSIVGDAVQRSKLLVIRLRQSSTNNLASHFGMYHQQTER